MRDLMFLFAHRQGTAHQTKLMHDDVFKKIRDEIHHTVSHIRPCGADGTTALHNLSSAIDLVLKHNNVDNNLWWGEVWVRSGRRDCAYYNQPLTPAK